METSDAISSSCAKFMPGCDFKAEAATEDELLKKAFKPPHHERKSNGMDILRECCPRATAPAVAYMLAS